MQRTSRNAVEKDRRPSTVSSPFSPPPPLNHILLTFSVVGGAVCGAGFYLYRLSQGTEVVWNRHGDWRPWDTVKQDQNVSLSSARAAIGPRVQHLHPTSIH